VPAGRRQQRKRLLTGAVCVEFSAGKTRTRCRELEAKYSDSPQKAARLDAIRVRRHRNVTAARPMYLNVDADLWQKDHGRGSCHRHTPEIHSAGTAYLPFPARYAIAAPPQGPEVCLRGERRVRCLSIALKGGTSMKIHTRLFIAGILALSLPTASRAASVEAWAGVVGGAGTGSIPNNCTTFGVPAELAPVLGSGSLQMQVLGGNAACGYSGGWTDKTAATGPLSNSASLAPVLLGSPGFTGSFDGTSSSQADFGSLSASAHGNISGGTPGSPVALFDSQGAFLFTDTLTATSPVLANGSAAFVQYLFAVSGNLSALGAPGPSLFGSTWGQVSLTMNNGPALGVVTATVNRAWVPSTVRCPPVGAPRPARCQARAPSTACSSL